MSTILLRIEKENRQDALVRALGHTYEIVVGQPPASAAVEEDLLILDHSTLQQSPPDAVRSYKTHDERPEAPVLLLVPSTQASSISTETWNQVDDVVEIPVRGEVMKTRVDTLIRLQEHAQEEKTFRHLSAKYKVMLDKQQTEVNGYKALFNTRTQAALVVNDWAIVEANVQAKQMFGTENLVGQSLSQFCPDEQADGQMSQEKADQLLEISEGETKRVDWTFKRRDGQKFISTVSVCSLQFKGESCIQILFPEEDEGDDVIPV